MPQDARRRRSGFATRAIHAAPLAGEGNSRPVVTPIVQSASFAFDDTEELAATLHDPARGFSYSRVGNPTVDVFERTLADLEDAEACVGFASGMAAVHAVSLALCAAGDHVVSSGSVYGNTIGFFRDVLGRMGVETTFVDTADPAAVARAITPRTRMVYTEAIGNPALPVADLPRLSATAREKGVPLVVDATFATPWLCRPVPLGADLVLHSATKYLGGHGDVIAGAVSGSSALIDRVRRIAIDTGGILEPFTAWLVLRGLKTLSLRMDRHCASAMRIAERLAGHARVAQVVYPGLPSHPHHAVAARVLSHGFGGMVGVEIAGGREAAAAVQHGLRVFQRAGSLGDAHSLVLQPALTSHRQLSPDELRRAGIPEGFLRLSVGLEDPDDLLEDLETALG